MGDENQIKSQKRNKKNYESQFSTNPILEMKMKKKTQFKKKRPEPIHVIPPNPQHI